MSDIRSKVETALNGIRPYLQADGGDIRVLSIEKKKVKLELLGNCSSCPMSAMTMKSGVEEAVLKAVPEVELVEAVNINDII